MTSNTQTIERIRSLLIKAKPQSGATEAERAGAQHMAFKLMKKHGITKEQLITAPSPQPKPRPQPKAHNQSNSWYTHRIPPMTAKIRSVQMLVVELCKISNDQKWFKFDATQDVITGEINVKCNNPDVMAQYFKLYEKCLVDEQLARLRERDRQFEEDIKRKKAEREAEEARKAQQMVANVQKMVIVGIMILVMMVAIVL